MLYINELPNDVICNTAICTDDTAVYSNKFDQASDLWLEIEVASELQSDLQDTMEWGKKWLVDLNAGKIQLVSIDWSNNTSAIDVKVDGSLLDGKASFKMLGWSSSFKLDWDYYIVSIEKTASKKIGALIFSGKFLSREVVLYVYTSIIQPCMECCCHFCGGAPSCYKNGYIGLLVLHLLLLLNP